MPLIKFACAQCGEIFDDEHLAKVCEEKHEKAKLADAAAFPFFVESFQGKPFSVHFKPGEVDPWMITFVPEDGEDDGFIRAPSLGKLAAYLCEYFEMVAER